MRLERALLLPLMYLAAFGLPAPHLIRVTALSDSSMELVWRNNSVEYLEVRIARKAQQEAAFQQIQVVSGTVDTYVDEGLVPATSYSYALVAVSASEVSDTSNVDSAVTRAGMLRAPELVSIEWDTGFGRNVITYTDSSDREVGFRLCRSDDLAAFAVVQETLSSDPKAMGEATVVDSPVSVNTWYTYRVDAYTEDTAVASRDSSVYNFESAASQYYVKLERAGAVPIVGSRWAARAGDTMIVCERERPPNSYSVIDISDKHNPLFQGYVGSEVLATYPLETLIPAYVAFEHEYGGACDSLWRRRFAYVDGRVVRTRQNWVLLYEASDTGLAMVDAVGGLQTEDSYILGVAGDTVMVGCFLECSALYHYEGGHWFYPIVCRDRALMPPAGMGPALHLMEICGGNLSGRNSLFGYTKNQLVYSEQSSESGSMCWVHDFNVNARFRRCHEYLSGSTNQFVAPYVTLVYRGGFPGPFTWVAPDLRVCGEAATLGSLGLHLVDGAYAVDVPNPVENVLVDTLDQAVFVFAPSLLSIYTYSFELWPSLARPLSGRGGLGCGAWLTTRGPGPDGDVQIVFSRPADRVGIYTIDGRLVVSELGAAGGVRCYTVRFGANGTYIVRADVNGRQVARRIALWR